MKNKVIAIGITLVFLIVGLIGCTEQQGITTEKDIENINPSNEDNNLEVEEEIQLSGISVITRWDTTYYGDWETRNGFYHNYPSKFEEGSLCRYVQYVISGNIKNIGNKPLDKVKITIKYLDDIGNELFVGATYIDDIYLGETKHFIVTNNLCYDYFEYVTDYTISTKITYHYV